jgi:hypothetical protein
MALPYYSDFEMSHDMKRSFELIGDPPLSAVLHISIKATKVLEGLSYLVEQENRLYKIVKNDWMTGRNITSHTVILPD